MATYAKFVVFGPLIISLVFLGAVAVGKIIERLDPYDQES